MSNEISNNKKIELHFPDASPDISTAKAFGVGLNSVKNIVASIDDIVNWFNKFQIDSIEISLSGGVETDGILKLFVNAKGEGGVKVVLKPKPQIKE